VLGHRADDRPQKREQRLLRRDRGGEALGAHDDVLVERREIGGADRLPGVAVGRKEVRALEEQRPVEHIVVAEPVTRS
jgi:hypothetical protein